VYNSHFHLPSGVFIEAFEVTEEPLKGVMLREHQDKSSRAISAAKAKHQAGPIRLLPPGNSRRPAANTAVTAETTCQLPVCPHSLDPGPKAGLRTSAIPTTTPFILSKPPFQTSAQCFLKRFRFQRGGFFALSWS
jgi:hypothetical protein